MGILNKTLDELASEMEKKVKKAFDKIKDNKEKILLLKNEIQKETRKIAQLNLDEESPDTSLVATQKKIRQLRYDLADAEERAEAYENIKTVFTEKDKKKLSEAYDKEFKMNRDEIVELYAERNRLQEEINSLQNKSMRISDIITVRERSNPAVEKSGVILEMAAQFDTELRKALTEHRRIGPRLIIKPWLNGESLEKFIKDTPE